MRQSMFTYRRMLRVFRHSYHGTRVLVKARHLVVSSMINYVWLARNSCLFEGVQIDVESIFKRYVLVFGCLLRPDAVSGVSGTPYLHCTF